MRSKSIASITVLVLMLQSATTYARHQGYLRTERCSKRRKSRCRVYTVGKSNKRYDVYRKDCEDENLSFDEDDLHSRDIENSTEYSDNLYIPETQDYSEYECSVLISVDTYESIGCKKSEYCRIPDGECSEDNLIGQCHEVNARCTREYKPVCGCNFKTYSNRCVALSNSVSVKYDGPCE